MTKTWKKYEASKKLVSSLQTYEIAEAIDLLKKTSYTKFDWTVEVAIKTHANPKYNDQNIRSTVVLPNGTWKTQRVAVFVSEESDMDLAKKAWADIVWNDTLIADIKSWKMEFDVLITTPTLMRDLAPVAKVLGPKWLMPSPKAWTVTTDIKTAVDEVKKWRLEFKLDKTWNIHCRIGKVSFETEKLTENYNSLLKAIDDNKPSWIKWKLIKKITLSATMSPWIQVVC